MIKKVLLSAALVATLAAGQAVNCPAYQNDNGAGACVFTSYYDTPQFLAAQNKAIADSLNATPDGPGGQFVKQYGNLPQNQQAAIFSCQVQIFTAKYFAGFPSPDQCLTNGAIDISKIVASNPAPTNPGNAPSVTYDAQNQRFVPVVPPQPGPATPKVSQAPATGTNLVGARSGAIFNVGPGAKSAGLTDGQRVNEGGTNYIFHGGYGLMGFGGYFTLAQ